MAGSAVLGNGPKVLEAFIFGSSCCDEAIAHRDE
jgi:hypothetical protein